MAGAHGRRARRCPGAVVREGGARVGDQVGGPSAGPAARRPVAALQARRPAHVAYVGSTSKSPGPAVRLGWIACPPHLLEALIEVKRLAERQTPPLEQLALADLLASGGYDRHLRARRRSYRQRRDTLVVAVTEHVPAARVIGIAAGLHLLLQPPQHTDNRRVATALRHHGVALNTLDHYLRADEPSDPAALVIGYATPSAHAYPAAVDALLTALADALR
ncbi:aminotransferase class I/II-fold pyridoxal phosphate-dependent enzyme [Kitasatospora sp. NPDC094028]